MTVFNRQWWTLKRTLPLLVLLTGALVIVVNYVVSMKYVDSIALAPDLNLTTEIMRRHVRELAVMSALLVIVIASVFGYVISRIVTRPVSQLADAANAMKIGQYDVSAHLKQLNELGEISEALDSLAIKAQAGQDTLSLNARLIDIVQLRDTAMDALDVGITISDARHPDNPLVYVNKGWCKMSGYDEQEMIGRPVRELQSSDENQPAHALIEQAQSKGEPVQVLMTSTRKDGSEFKDELYLSPVHNSAGLLTHYIGVNRDVTSVLDTQRQLENVHRLESVGLLSGGIAHDFNNLLAVIQGNLEFLKDQISDPLQVEYLQEAENASNMGARLTKRLLTFARRSSLEHTSLDVNAQVLDAVELLRSAVGESITLSTSLAVDLWPIYSDQSQLENAIINLTINARDAIEHHGKIMLQTDNKTLDDTSGGDVVDIPSGDYVRLRVTDDGCGMSADVQSRVLEPFFTTKDHDRGTGLGLSTIYGFVKQTGGHLRINSRTGKGTSVTLYFPRYLKHSCVATDE